MIATRPEPDWVPQRNDEVYCSPACGAHCKWSAHEEALHQSELLAKKLGVGWEPRVWENMNWYYSARYGDILNVHPSGREYAAYAANGKWVGNGDTPIRAVIHALSLMDTDLAELKSICTQTREALSKHYCEAHPFEKWTEREKLEWGEAGYEAWLAEM